jgi:hypothetical protein
MKKLGILAAVILAMAILACNNNNNANTTDTKAKTATGETKVVPAAPAGPNFTNPKMWNTDWKKAWDSFDKNLKVAGFKMTGHGQTGHEFSVGPWHFVEEYYRYQNQKGDVKVAATKSVRTKVGDNNSAPSVDMPAGIIVEGKIGPDARQACLIGYIASSMYYMNPDKRADWLKNQLPRDMAELWSHQSKGKWQIWKTGSYKPDYINFAILSSLVKDRIAVEFFIGGFTKGRSGIDWTTFAPPIDPPPSTPLDLSRADNWTGYPAACFDRNVRRAGFMLLNRAIIYHHNTVCVKCLYRKGSAMMKAMIADGGVRAVKIVGKPDENFRQGLLASYVALALLEFHNQEKLHQWFDFGLPQDFNNIWTRRRQRIEIDAAPVGLVMSPGSKGSIYALMDSRGWANEAWGMHVP